MPSQITPRLRVVAVLLTCMTAIAAVRWHTYDEPLEMDASTYAVVARELRSGRRLYTDLWDHKPPAIHLTFAAAQAVAGSGPAHVFLLAVTAACLTLLGLYAAGEAMAGTQAGLMAAVFWAVLSGDLGLQANQPNTEVFMNAALIWIVAVLARAPLGQVSRTRAVGLGALIAVATLYKHVAAVPAAALLAGHLVGTSHSAVEGSHATRRLAIAIAIVGAAWVGVALYFAAVDRFADFWGAVIGFNQLYAGNPVNNLLDGVVFDRLVPPALYFALPLTAATVLGLTAGTMVARWRTMLVTYAVGVACAVALPGYFLPHYYQLWLPVLCLGAALGLAALRPQLISPRTWWLRAGGSLTALLLVTQLPTLGEPSQEWSRRKFGERLVRSTALAEAVDALLLPGETFFEWGHEAELYYYSGRRPPGGEFRCEHLLRGPREPERSARLLADLRREQPELVLVSAVHPFPLEHAVPSWIIANYADADASTRALLKAGDYRVLLRRGGALERRLRFRAVTAAATP